MNLNPEEVKKKITARTGAVLPVHLFGRMADMDGIMNAASGIPVLVEDACQAIGAFSTKHSPASTGVAAALSFFPTKNLGGAGDGGMVLTGDPEIAETVRVLRNHGQDQNGFIAQAGCTGRLDALQAAVLSVKLPYLDSWNGRRRENARYYLENLPAAVSFQLPEEGHAYHQFTIRIPDRDRIRAKLAELGIPTAIYYPTPIHLQPLYRGLGYREGDFPVAERLSREVLSLPVCPFLKNEDRERVAAALKSELKETEFIK